MDTFSLRRSLQGLPGVLECRLALPHLSFFQCVRQWYDRGYLRQIVVIRSCFRLDMHLWDSAAVPGTLSSVDNRLGRHVISRDVGLSGVWDIRRLLVVVSPMAHHQFGETRWGNIRDVAIAVASIGERETIVKGWGGHTFHTDCGSGGEGPCLCVLRVVKFVG
jgi:hypothetical protein